MYTTWETVRVFVSSTFLDMQAERDHLVRFVFPRLREQLLPRRIHLVDVDLRWGITSEQDSTEACREIITQCRGFLCMLGGRYGTIPKGKELSITADEIHFGVLDRALKDRSFAYFYFRDDAATTAMVETTPGELREPQGSNKQNKLAELKQAIVAAELNPFSYAAQWDNESRRLTGLKKFGDRVYDDLLNSMKSDPELRDRFMMDTAGHLDEFAEENAAMEAFVEERSERFVLGSRETVLEELLAHANATGGNGYVCLTGTPGSGKSALLAHLSKHSTLNDQTSTLLIRHFVGASPGSTDVRRTLRRLCHELKAGCPGIAADIPDDPEKLRDAFPDFLRQACARQRVVILLDAVNQFDPASHSAGLYWLPEELPDNARFILSALDGPALEELRRRPRKPREIELKPLTAADGEAIIEQFRRRYRKKFEPNQRIALLAKTDSDKPLYLLAALEELRTLGTYEEITQRITELPPKTHELFAWILERLENDDGFRDAAGWRVGRELVSRFAALLGASRYGLSQRELADLLDADDPQGNVAALLHLLRPYLMHRGELLDFYHRQFREAAQGEYLETNDQRLCAHRAIADHLESLGAGCRRTLTELTYHLVEAARSEPYPPVVGADAPLNDRLYAHVRDQVFRQAQVEQLGGYGQCLQDLSMVVRLLAVVQEPSPAAHAHLCWAALESGQLVAKAEADAGATLGWSEGLAQDGIRNLSDVLQRLHGQGEREFFKACLVLLWQEADRQAAMPEPERSLDSVEAIFRQMRERLPEGPGTVDWRLFIPVNFMIWLTIHVLDRMPQLDLRPFTMRATDLEVFHRDLVREVSRGRIGVSGPACLELTLRAGWWSQHKGLRSEVVEAMGRLGMMEPAIQLAEGEQERDGILASVACGLAHAGRFTEACQIADRIRSDQNNNWALARISEAFSDADCPDEALDCLKPVQGDWDRQRALVAAAAALARRGDLVRARQLADSVQDDFHRGEVLVAVTRGMACSGSPDEALDLTSAFGIDYWRSEGVLAVSRGLADAGRFDQAIRIARTFDGERWKLDQTLATLVSMMTNAGSHRLAVEALDLIEDGRYRNEALTVLAVRLAEVGRFDEAWSHAERVSDLPEQGVFSTAYRTVRDRSPTFAVFCDLVQTTTRLGAAALARRALDRALSILDELAGDWTTPEGICYLARALAEGGDGAAARDMFWHVATDPAGQQVAVESPGALASLAGALKERGRRREARTILQRLLTQAESHMNHWQRFEAHRELIGIIGQFAEPRMVWKAFQGALQAVTNFDRYQGGQTEEACTALVESVGELADVQLRFELLDQLDKSIRHLTAVLGRYPSERAMSQIARLYGRVGKSEEARRLVQNMKHQQDRFQADRGILLRSVELGDEIAVLQQIHDEGDSWQRRLLIQDVAEFITKSKTARQYSMLLHQLLLQARAIPDQWARIHALAALSDLVVDNPAFESDCRHLRQELRHELDAILDDSNITHVQMRCVFVATLAKYGDRATACSVLEGVANLIAELAHRQSSVNSEAEMALRAMADAGMFDDALDHARMMEDDMRVYQHEPTPRHHVEAVHNVDKSKAISYLVQAILKSGDHHRALDVATQIPDEQQRARSLAEAATTIAAAGRDAVFDEFASSVLISRETWRRTIAAWRSALLGRGGAVEPLLRRSMAYRPSDAVAACDGVYALLAALVRAGDGESIKAIVTECPLVKLDFLQI